jgi:predicted P-loop ATPase
MPARSGDDVRHLRPAPAGQDWMQDHTWDWTAEGGLRRRSAPNLKKMLHHHPLLVGMFVYDEFRDEMIMTRGLPGDDRERYPTQLSDADEFNVAAFLGMQGVEASVSAAAAGIRAVAVEHVVNPLKDWLQDIVWDGRERIDKWLATYAGAIDDEYTSTVGRKFMISAVARVMEPGCKCDTMPVFEGPQGAKKSMLLRTLAGRENFSDQIGDISNKDAQAMIQGRWIIEIPELDKFSKKETDTVKDWLARQEDRYRPPYGRNVITRPRRCVFAGTINPLLGSGYLRDQTGARRFWPIACGRIDIEAIERDRAHLWAEAVEMYAMARTWWIDEAEAKIVVGIQEDRTDDDIWTTVVEDWLRAAPDMFTMSQVLKEACGVEVSRQDQRMKLRMSSILTALRCERAKAFVGGRQQRVYTRGTS